METRNNIDEIIRKKFESFEPSPPSHVWDEISKGIDSKTALLPFSKKWIAGALIALLSISTFVIIDPFDIIYNSSINVSHTDITIPMVEDAEEIESKNIVSDIETDEDEVLPAANTIHNSKNISQKGSDKVEDKVDEDKPEITRYNSEFGSGFIGSVGMKHSDFLLSDEIVQTTGLIKMPDITDENEYNDQNATEIIDETEKGKKGYWAIGLNIWPELTVSNIDSVEILNSYSFNIEPTYYFNKHWFLRSGLGASYTRDRGFAEIKYYVKELMGTYEDVYNVTFDSIDGVVVPTYHTKTVEVWDSIKHISISNVTNKYLYLNVPLLFSYSSGNDTKTLNWHAFAGPVFYFNAKKWIQEPAINDKDAEIIELHNNLPIRNNYYLQLWIGAGLNYRINDRLGLNVEPSYFYYITDVYKNKGVNSPKSGFGLRVGLQFKLK